MKFTRMSSSLPNGDEIVEYVEMSGDRNFSLQVTKDGMHFQGVSPVFRTKNGFVPVAKMLGEAIKDYWRLSDAAGFDKKETLKDYPDGAAASSGEEPEPTQH